MVRSWAALRVMSEYGYPIYDRSVVFPGAAVASCHSGVTLAAAHWSWPVVVAAGPGCRTFKCYSSGVIQCQAFFDHLIPAAKRPPTRSHSSLTALPCAVPSVRRSQQRS